MSQVIREDVAAIAQDLGTRLQQIEGSRWLISGGAGFLGGYFIDLLHYCNRNLLSKAAEVVCVENFSSGTPQRIMHLAEDDNFHFIQGDITKPLKLDGPFDYMVHAASIASPTFYRKYPLETIEANVLGLRNLLEESRSQGGLKSFLFFSTSEIYGDPPPERIPTPEDYNGNVSCTGPRACYDEAKRLGETMAVNYWRQHGLPVKIVRPFNVYGPGLRLEDKRVLPDFFMDALTKGRIAILSDGTPTRSFCYISDAITGFMGALLSEHQGEAFNIGNDEEEISMKALAQLVAEVVGDVEVEFGQSPEGDYLKDNPQRRCPDLSKARSLLNYQPNISLRQGLRRLLSWYQSVYNLGGEGS